MYIPLLEGGRGAGEGDESIWARVTPKLRAIIIIKNPIRGRIVAKDDDLMIDALLPFIFMIFQINQSFILICQINSKIKVNWFDHNWLMIWTRSSSSSKFLDSISGVRCLINVWIIYNEEREKSAGGRWGWGSGASSPS